MMMRARPSYLLAISQFSFSRPSYACSVSSRRSRPFCRRTEAANGSAASAAGSARLSSLSIMEMRLPRRVVETTFVSPPTSGSSCASTACPVSCMATHFLPFRHTKMSFCIQHFYISRCPRAPGRGYIPNKKHQLRKRPQSGLCRSVFFPSWVTPRKLCAGNEPDPLA